MTRLKTMAVAAELGVPYHRIFGLLRSGKIVPPGKDTSGDYIWTERELEMARRALAASRQRSK